MPKRRPSRPARPATRRVGLTIQARQLEGEEIAAELRQQLTAVVEEYDHTQIVIDLQHIQYISSVALSPLLALRKKLRERGGQIIICNLSRSVGDVFYATKLVSSSGDFAAPFEMAPDVPRPWPVHRAASA
jgi:anti-anti-sigma factor